MTMLESLACATPVIASKEGGMADTIIHGETGFLFDINKPRLLTRYVRELLENEPKYNYLKANAEKGSYQFDWNNLAPRYLAAYKHCLK